MAARRCPAPKCPTLIHGTTRYCTTHAREYETRRGTSTQRGYDATHRRERTRWAQLLRQQPLPCARCGNPINPGDTWDLGHTDDRTTWTGPEHSSCNRKAGGKASHQWRN